MLYILNTECAALSLIAYEVLGSLTICLP